MNENKQAICDALAETLKLTCSGKIIDRIEYNPSEYVLVYYKGTAPTAINVVGDSDTAMIKNIMRGIPL